MADRATMIEVRPTTGPIRFFLHFAIGSLAPLTFLVRVPADFLLLRGPDLQNGER